MDLSRLKIFYKVAREGNLMKAATSLHVSQSALSRQIQMLEQELKTQLFERTSKGVKLTPEGEKVFIVAKDIVEKAEHLEKTLLENPNEPAGDIHIITTPAVGETELTFFLLEFLEKYPDIKIRITTKIDNLNLQDADVTIRTFILNHPELKQLHLKSFHMKLWASQAYLDKFGVPKTLKDLDNHRILVFERDYYNPYSNTNWILHVGIEAEQISREPFYTITSNEGLYKAALKGYGIVHLPKEYVKIQGGGLVEVLPAIEGPRIDVYFIYSKRLEKFKRINLLYEFLHKKFSNL
jgi:DNA-binding transcriptional LysR family regulator